MKKEIIEQVLGETEAGYDLVADKFSATRRHFWRDLEFIKDYTQGGDKILDFGCGNGRLLELFHGKNVRYFGVDVSQKLIEAAQDRYVGKGAKFFKTNAGQASLPFADNFFNTVYAIAVFHHLPGAELRLDAVKELYRVTAPGGHVVITVWNLWRKKYLENILRNWAKKIERKSNLDWSDCRIDFKNNQDRIFPRYHHAFTKRELRKIFCRAGFVSERCEVFSGRNIVFIGRKPPSENG